MKTKLFIVTYNSPQMLNTTLQSLFSSDFDQNQEVFILNNHTNFLVEPEFGNRVKVLHNQARPDWSTGHLSRSWNQTLLHGFKSLSNPDADVIVTAQDDTDFSPTWFSELQEHLKTYSFITSGAGDNFCCYTVEAIKNIGIWDERYCNIGYQEADYFLRAILYNKDKSSITDVNHGRFWQPLSSPLVKRPYSDFLQRSKDSFSYHNVSLQVFEQKWPGIPAAFWDHNVLEKIKAFTRPGLPTYVTYPYFEKDIPNKEQKGYVHNF